MNATMRPEETNPEHFQFGQVPNDRFEHPRLPYTAFSMVAIFGDPSLVVGLPYGGTVTFDLRRFPQRTWVQLQEPSGESIPLAIYVDHGAVGGRWLTPGA
jgi:hypothetical protein